MKKIKKIFAVLATLTMIFSFGAMAACNDKNGGDSSSQQEQPAPTSYTVKVVDAEGNPVKNLALNFCIGEQCAPARTDDNGVAVFAFSDPDIVYHVEYKDPLGKYTKYGYTDFNTTPGTYEYTMTLTPAGTLP